MQRGGGWCGNGCFIFTQVRRVGGVACDSATGGPTKSGGARMYKNVELIQVSRTRLELRGNGDDDPFRQITQYWSVEGELLAERDPSHPTLLGRTG